MACSCSSSAVEVTARAVRRNLDITLEILADSPLAVFRVSLGGFWRGASASVHRRVVVTSVETVAQTGDSMVQFRMVVDLHVAVQMTGY